MIQSIEKIITEKITAWTTVTTYIGTANMAQGVSLSTAKGLAIWQIEKRVDSNVWSSPETSDDYYPVDADGNMVYTQNLIWNDRAGLTYK